MYAKSHKKSRTWHQIQDCFLFELLVVADADEVAGLAGGVPGDVKPAGFYISVASPAAPRMAAMM